MYTLKNTWIYEKKIWKIWIITYKIIWKENTGILNIRKYENDLENLQVYTFNKYSFIKY